jgi:hypothetical protein
VAAGSGKRGRGCVVTAWKIARLSDTSTCRRFIMRVKATPSEILPLLPLENSLPFSREEHYSTPEPGMAMLPSSGVRSRKTSWMPKWPSPPSMSSTNAYESQRQKSSKVAWRHRLPAELGEQGDGDKILCSLLQRHCRARRIVNEGESRYLW